jgi:hypothetical protein
MNDRLAKYYDQMPNVFQPENLKKDQDRELFNWAYGKGNSLFVKWVPDELVDDLTARAFFEQYGEVDRIDFVPKMNAQGKKSGHMAFVHFREFHSVNFTTDVANAYPEPLEVDLVTTNRFGSQKVFKLKLCVNTRPIPKVVEFNASQMTDMIQLLNTRLANETAALKVENDRLRESLAMMTLRIASVERRLEARPSSPVGVQEFDA